MLEDSIFTRTEKLLGEESLKKITSSAVAVFGLGGVGGTAFEALVRSGVGTIYAIDRDTFDVTNLNRQILGDLESIGKSKALLAKDRASRINPDAKVIPEIYSVNEASLKEHDYSSCSFLLDCMDDIPAKIALIHLSIEKKIPLIISLGMGNRLDPSKVHLERLDKTSGDPLAKKLRNELRKENVNLKDFMAVISSELPLVKDKKPASLMMVPSAAGLLIAYYVISSLAK